MVKLPIVILLLSLISMLGLGLNSIVKNYYQTQKVLQDYFLNRNLFETILSKPLLTIERKNPFQLLSPNPAEIIASTSAKITANTDTTSLTVILGCQDEKEKIISSFEYLSTICNLKTGTNEIFVFNFDKNYTPKELRLGLISSDKLTLESSLTLAKVGLINQIKDNLITLNSEQEKVKFSLTEKTGYFNPKLEQVSSEALRIGEKILIYYEQSNLGFGLARLVVQFPLDSTLKNPTVVYSTFKEIINDEIILPNLADPTFQPRHVKLLSLNKAKLKSGDLVEMKNIKFGTRIVVIGKYDNFGNVEAESIYILDSAWKSQETSTSSSLLSSPSAQTASSSATP